MLDPHLDHTRGTFEDSFLGHILSDALGEMLPSLGWLLIRVTGWIFWQGIRLLCALLSEALTSWTF